MSHKTLHIKKDDEVVVISGVAKGDTGKVLRTFPGKERVIIEGVNMRRKHVRPRKQGEKGQIVMVPASVHASNVKLLTPAKKKVAEKKK